MTIRQFEYKPLAHYSYAILSNGEMAIVDPERNPQQYYDFAAANSSKITAVIETHPHADFVSSHLEIHKLTGARIYNSKKLGGNYPHKNFDEGDELSLGNVTLKAINTPGHSPDSITVVAKEGDNTALFTGDTLFIGDVGRPDLREKAGNMKAKREELAEMMYHSIQHKFSDLPDSAKIYPTHGAGSLCGKSMSDASSSTLGDERKNNWAFKKQSKEEFIEKILDGQPFIPSYFGYNVDLNKNGAKNLHESISHIPFEEKSTATGLIIDTRDEEDFKNGHLEGSINIMAVSENSKFETWLGSIVKPKEAFSLVIKTKDDKNELLQRVAKIGYEKQLKKIITLSEDHLDKMKRLDLEYFENNLDKFTVVDIRNQSEINKGKFFESARPYPLNELRKTASKIPTDKPIVVHCAGGYRSAAGSSILKRELGDALIYDLSDAIKKFKS